MEKTLTNRMKNIMMKMMISCEQATYLVDKEQYVDLSFKDKFDLKFHLATCKFCRLYKTESHLINKELSKVFTLKGEEVKLSEEQKKKMLEKLDSHISKNEVNKD